MKPMYLNFSYLNYCKLLKILLRIYYFFERNSSHQTHKFQQSHMHAVTSTACAIHCLVLPYVVRSHVTKMSCIHKNQKWRHLFISLWNKWIHRKNKIIIHVNVAWKKHLIRFRPQSIVVIDTICWMVSESKKIGSVCVCLWIVRDPL